MTALFAARYRLALRQEIVVGGVPQSHREGFVLRVEGGGLGDLCPLPGLSAETLAEAEAALRAEAPLPPSASWAMASACQAKGAVTVKTAALLGSLQDPPPDALALKLKVGRADLDDELAWVASVAGSTDCELRLDGNRMLSLDAARTLFEAAGSRASFFEEPVPEADLDEALLALPIALDETLALRTPTGAAAWVLKPTVLGHTRTRELLRLADARVIISAAYESAVGMRALHQLAHEVAPDDAHGLGTSAAFAEDLDVELLAQAAQLDWQRWT